MQGRGLARLIGAARYFECSGLTADGIGELFAESARHILRIRVEEEVAGRGRVAGYAADGLGSDVEMEG